MIPIVSLPPNLGADLTGASGLLFVFFAGLAILLYDVLLRPRDKRVLLWMSLGTVFVSLALTVLVQAEAHGPGLMGMVRFDAYGTFFNVLLLIGAGLALMISPDYLERVGIDIGEYYPLALFALFGMMLMSMASDLIMIFVALEVMSISFYVLTGIKRADSRAVESAFKYFILGAFASGILLYGVSFIYGATGTTNLEGIALAVASGSAGGPVLLTGMGMVLAGFAFKVGAVPFHMWTPDVYSGAPSSVTGYMATGVKAASFAAFTRVLLVAFPGLREEWVIPLWGIAAATMLLGNIAALVQSDLKRMLAYSSIAHAGYILMALVAGDGAHLAGNTQLSGVLFYLLAYTFMTLGAFAVLTMMARDGEDVTDIEGLTGLAAERPLLAAGLSVTLLSLAGIPPTMGFVGKFYLFAAAVNGGYYALAAIGALSAAIGVYYYLRPIVAMYMRGGKPFRFPPTSAAYAALAVACLFLIVFGIMPGELLDRCRAGLLSLGV